MDGRAGATLNAQPLAVQPSISRPAHATGLRYCPAPPEGDVPIARRYTT
jgi:hypothetical protein